MSNTSVQTAPSPAAGRDDAKPVAGTARWPGVVSFLKPLASLRLTVVLFVLSLLLVFFGTMAQIDNGIGTVMKEYFRWWWVWVPWRLLVQFGQVFFGVPQAWNVSGAFPFPGGWTLGTLLLINLIAAHPRPVQGHLEAVWHPPDARRPDRADARRTGHRPVRRRGPHGDRRGRDGRLHRRQRQGRAGAEHAERQGRLAGGRRRPPRPVGAEGRDAHLE
ncbi:MAG: hypothetical protein U0797_13385 [Gemmataceae bacterium]